MPPKYSTRRHKFKNKNAKTSKQYKQKKAKGIQKQKKRIQRPDEITFDNAERVEFITGFAKRKQQRRIQAARDLITIQHQQSLDLRKQRREEEIDCLVKGGYIKDPVAVFLEERSNASDTTDNEELDDLDSERVIDLDELANDTNDERDCKQMNESSKMVNYENEDTVTTVITSSVPNTIDMNIERLLNEGEELLEHEELNGDSMEWMYHSNGEQLTVYQQRKERKKQREEMERKKKHGKKIRKMMSFMKEFQRKKKRKSNAKFSKRKRKK
mmetsp:Transcript_12173/g.19468  ORF Transcript_12173/g.19468 Transcript_12173/m.19468 type:complete len:271 (+) Transcript_12173:41-853(+)|eukprot:CAMPEP_0197053524 /NCGR_PEP_ID=MMETSP1384-20130603/27777_1 /TAXON_ID=29189 /ORGANISM="Ammonia sp." /LENGTH=270 /DNA_ID=CAMNT_0042486437 /DNA_START=41 /DNA_END=853 /DNA_ORIENTATION=-